MWKRETVEQSKGLCGNGTGGRLQYQFSLTGEVCSVTGLTENGASNDLAEVWSMD